MDSTSTISGTLHIAVAFDWGEEIDLEHAKAIVPSEPQALPRRRRTPPSIGYRVAPLLIRLAPTSATLPESGNCVAQVEVTVFDFGAVSVGLHIPLNYSAEQLSRLASHLSDASLLTEVARQTAQPLYEQLLPAIKKANWNALTEEYFTFQFLPGAGVPSPTELLDRHAGWFAGLIRLDNTPLSEEEVDETLRLRISYSPDDLVVVEWSAAVVIDRDCEETLQTIEFANLQLLEFRCIDARVQRTLEHACSLIHPLAESRLPFWRLQTRPLRVLGDMRIDAVLLFERASSSLKLVGDQYLARLYRMLATRSHLDELTQDLRQSFDEAQGVYQILADQSATYRIELLEIIVIILIAMEIVLAFWR